MSKRLQEAALNQPTRARHAADQTEAHTSALYLNSRSLFPRRSRTSQWELKASCGGMPQRMMALRKAFRWRALNPRTWREDRVDIEAGHVTRCPVKDVRLWVLWVSPRYCRRLSPAGAAEVCPSRSSAADGSVCVHLKRRRRGFLIPEGVSPKLEEIGSKNNNPKVYHRASPRSLRPRPRTPRSTPTDCLKDQPAILSRTSKRNSTLHSLPLVATRGRHGTADYYRPLGFSQTGRWEVATLPDYQFKLTECSQPRGAPKSLRSPRRRLLNFEQRQQTDRLLSYCFFLFPFPNPTLQKHLNRSVLWASIEQI